MNWILLSAPPLSSDPDSPPKFGTCSKCITFQKNNKVNKKSQFYIDNKPVSNVSEFTYLGINITANGNFIPTLTNLSSKGMKAIFALNSKFKLKRLPPKAAFKLSDSTIMPILTYGSEVWGIFMNMDYSKWDKCAIEKTHLQFCKHILGVNRTCSNHLVRYEAGW